MCIWGPYRWKCGHDRTPSLRAVDFVHRRYSRDPQGRSWYMNKYCGYSSQNCIPDTKEENPGNNGIRRCDSCSRIWKTLAPEVLARMEILYQSRCSRQRLLLEEEEAERIAHENRVGGTAAPIELNPLALQLTSSQGQDMGRNSQYPLDTQPSPYTHPPNTQYPPTTESNQNPNSNASDPPRSFDSIRDAREVWERQARLDGPAYPGESMGQDMGSNTQDTATTQTSQNPYDDNVQLREEEPRHGESSRRGGSSRQKRSSQQGGSSRQKRSSRRGERSHQVDSGHRGEGSQGHDMGSNAQYPPTTQASRSRGSDARHSVNDTQFYGGC
ncbi:hypothetical protein B0J14DRAFT_568261 [Halenospora varia]|nr:hypothetical protein B0J14DRAFT_568261 [Halenospora varia]